MNLAQIITIFILTIIVTLVVTVPLYIWLLDAIAADHPQHYARLGRPTILNGSPRVSLALQRFIYVDSRETGISPRVATLSRILGIVTPLLVGLIFVEMLLATWLAVGG